MIALPPIIGVSQAMKDAIALVERYASSTLSILLVGATGTGKELFARHIHRRSGRVGRFVPVNCAALPKEMTESLLFGHRRGAFSSAFETRRGYVEQASHGTLFFDELLCLPSDSQAKLLRAVDTGEIQPLGDEVERLVDVRVVATVQEDLWGNLEAGFFRSDLFQRVAGVVIVLPALSQRCDDILPIARFFTEQTGRVLEASAAAVLESYAWPGNVRELRQVIERASRLVENGTLPPAAIAEAIRLGARPQRRPSTGMDRSREEWLEIATANDWDVARMAHALGVRRTQLYARLKASGTSLRDLRKSGSSAGRPPDKPDVPSVALS